MCMKKNFRAGAACLSSVRSAKGSVLAAVWNVGEALEAAKLVVPQHPEVLSFSKCVCSGPGGSGAPWEGWWRGRGEQTVLL